MLRSATSSPPRPRPLPLDASNGAETLELRHRTHPHIVGGLHPLVQGLHLEPWPDGAHDGICVALVPVTLGCGRVGADGGRECDGSALDWRGGAHRDPSCRRWVKHCLGASGGASNDRDAFGARMGCTARKKVSHSAHRTAAMESSTTHTHYLFLGQVHLSSPMLHVDWPR